MNRCAAASAALLLALGAVSLPARALADGDPASDVLLGQAVFLPYSPVSRGLQGRLYALTAAAAARGYPIHLALIGAPTDLGVVPALFGKPQDYARFLSSELTGPVRGPVLVVMPHGFGLARAGRGLSRTRLVGLTIGPSSDGLAAAAVAAIPRLAAAAGHPLPAGAGMARATTGASGATVRHALTAIGVMAVLAAVGIGTGWRARSRMPRAG
ncbi:MAG TPA: hypothetical protein VLP43_12380 [Solirubrobacteraceae bacterium]|nr:hypothetical protein [Solirubrobacteraceae bacterium]